MSDWQPIETAPRDGTEIQQARELYGELRSYAKVGVALGVPWRTVADWIRRDTRWGAK